MSYGKRIFLQVALAFGLLAPLASAQKPSGPAPPPSSSSPTRPSAPVSPASPSMQPEDDFVVFLSGHIATEDGTAVPNDVLIERVCNETVRQQVYAAPGGSFSMQLGSRADSFDPGADRVSPYGVAPNPNAATAGIPRRELSTCELRASASGFYPRTVSLLELTTTPSSSSIDVGSVVVHRAGKVEGTTLSAAPYKAPQPARRAYDKGLHAQRNGKLPEARQHFEKAVEIYPQYANAWYQLGAVLQEQNQKEEARSAYTRAAAIDARYLAPYLSLAALALEAQNWPEVLKFTNHILELDPLNHAEVTGYILDLDPVNYAEAYFYNAVANYNLKNFAAAEKAGRKAEHVNLRTRFPQLHLLLADIFAAKHDYDGAISEMQTYLELAPNAKDTPQVRQLLAKIQTLNGPASPTQQSDHQ